MHGAVRTFAVALLAALMTACANPASPTCNDPECQVEVSLMALYPNESLPLGEVASVPYVQGFQGGTMIRPFVVFPPDAVRVDEALRVTLSHRPDPSAPEAYGEVANFGGFEVGARVVERDGARVVGPFDDQIGWDDPTGARFILDVEVNGRVAGYASSAITILPADHEPDPYPECNSFELLEGGCSYRRVPTDVMVSAITDAPTDACPDGVTVAVREDPSDQNTRDCLEATLASLGPNGGRTIDVPISSNCLQEEGIEVGSAAEALFEVEVVGTCAPLLVNAAGKLETCRQRCAPN